MKKIILNIMATTGIALVVLALVALCYDASMLCISSVFQVLGLNIVIYAGMYLLNRFEYPYPILETGLKLVYVLALVLVCGWIFDWYASTPIFVLIPMAIGIFVVCLCLDAISLMGEVKTINKLINNEEK